MSMPYLHKEETKLLLQVKEDLARHESFREFAYPDPLSKIGKKYRGKDWPWGMVPAMELLERIPDVDPKDGAPWTYGFGFTHGVTPESRIERIRAERKLEEHILEMKHAIGVALPWFKESSFVTHTVLINMAFNMGLKGLLQFRNTLKFVKEKNYKQAAQNMKLSLWYSQVGYRAEELANRMSTQTIEPQHKAKEAIQ